MIQVVHLSSHLISHSSRKYCIWTRVEVRFSKLSVCMAECMHRNTRWTAKETNFGGSRYAITHCKERVVDGDGDGDGDGDEDEDGDEDGDGD
jgi:hypothetical protein